MSHAYMSGRVLQLARPPPGEHELLQPGQHRHHTLYSINIRMSQCCQDSIVITPRINIRMSQCCQDSIVITPCINIRMCQCCQDSIVITPCINIRMSQCCQDSIWSSRPVQYKYYNESVLPGQHHHHALYKY